MGVFIDRTGQRYGRLTAQYVSRRAERLAGGGKANTAWACICDCGARIDVLAGSLACGETTSCGCYRKETTAKQRLTHGHTIREGDRQASRTYKSWRSMHQRCSNPNDRTYSRYGARGISVCERWGTFDNFLADMGLRPPGTSIDRRDNDKGYYPGNCRWATPKEQRANQRRSNPQLPE